MCWAKQTISPCIGFSLAVSGAVMVSASRARCGPVSSNCRVFRRDADCVSKRHSRSESHCASRLLARGGRFDVLADLSSTYMGMPGRNNEVNSYRFGAAVLGSAMPSRAGGASHGCGKARCLLQRANLLNGCLNASTNDIMPLAAKAVLQLRSRTGSPKARSNSGTAVETELFAHSSI